MSEKRARPATVGLGVSVFETTPGGGSSETRGPSPGRDPATPPLLERRPEGHGAGAAGHVSTGDAAERSQAGAAASHDVAGGLILHVAIGHRWPLAFPDESRSKA